MIEHLPGQEIIDVATHGLEGWVTLGSPHRRYLAHQHAVKDFLKLRRHHHQTLDGLLDVLQTGADHGGEAVETDQLLPQDSVHRLFIGHRVLLDHLQR